MAAVNDLDPPRVEIANLTVEGGEVNVRLFVVVGTDAAVLQLTNSRSAFRVRMTGDEVTRFLEGIRKVGPRD